MAKEGNYREFTKVPPYEQAQWSDKTVKPINQREGTTLWGGKEPPPAIGTRIHVTMNSLGPATVKGYFIECDWLGVRVEFHKPPKWWLKQNPQRPLGHIFGMEIKPAQET